MPAFLDPHHLFAFLIGALRACAWLVLISLVFVPLERFFPLHPRKLWQKSLVQDLEYYFVSSLVPGLLLVGPLALAAWAGHAFVPWRMQTLVASWPLWQRVTVGFVVGEIGFYWGHRWAHEIPFLWRFHSIHHSPGEIYFLVSARAHPIDNVFIRLCGLIPAVLLGVASPLSPNGTLVPVLIVLTATLWGFLIHANVRWRLGPLEWLIATPGFHHWHHTMVDHKDRNYASMLPVMDWIFGTFYLPRAWPAQYGVEAKLPSSLLGQMTYPIDAPVPLTESATADGP